LEIMLTVAKDAANLSRAGSALEIEAKMIEGDISLEIYRLKRGPFSFVEAARSGRPFRRIGDKCWSRTAPDPNKPDEAYWLETKRGAVWQSEYMMNFPVSYVLGCNFEIMPEGEE